MGYSQCKKFLFIRPEKVGGTSLNDYFDRHVDGYQNNHSTHFLASEMRDVLGPDKYTTFFKCSVTRNP